MVGADPGIYISSGAEPTTLTPQTITLGISGMLILWLCGVWRQIVDRVLTQRVLQPMTDAMCVCLGSTTASVRRTV